MSVREKNGRLEYRFMLAGQRVRESTGLVDTERNRKKAAEMEAAHRQAIIEGRLGVRRLTPRLFADATKEFLSYLQAVRQSSSTVHRVKTSLASASVFFEKQVISMIHVGMMERYVSWRLTEHRVKPVTVKHDVDNLSLFFQWAVKNNYARENPTREADKPSDKDAKRQHVLTETEERRYFAVARGNLRDVGRIMILQGARPEEVMSMRKADVDLAAGVWTVSKSKTEAGTGRTLRLAPESIAIIGSRMGGYGSWVFPSPKRRGEHIGKLNCPHDRACAKAGVHFVLYDLRHTFATRMIAAGCDIATLKDIMGHTDIRITQRYVHPTREQQFSATERYHATIGTGKEAVQ